MELDGVPQKNDDYFHWGPLFYVCSSARNWVSSMYKGIHYIRNSLRGVATVDVWSSSTRTFQQKKPGLPKWSISFYIVLKKMFFQAHRRVPPMTGVVELWRKTYFAMTTNGIRRSSSKNDDDYFHWGPIFYVCNSARNWVSSMYKGIYHIRNSLWGVATVDVWSSSTRTFQPKKTGPPKWSIPFYIVLTKWTFQAHRRVPPTTGVVELWKKIILQWQPMELGGLPQKKDDYFH